MTDPRPAAAEVAQRFQAALRLLPSAAEVAQRLSAKEEPMTRLTEAARLCEHVRERYGDLAAPAKFVAEALLLVIEEMKNGRNEQRGRASLGDDATGLLPDMRAEQAGWCASGRGAAEQVPQRIEVPRTRSKEEERQPMTRQMTAEERAATVVQDVYAKRQWGYDPNQHAEFETAIADAIRAAEADAVAWFYRQMPCIHPLKFWSPLEGTAHGSLLFRQDPVAHGYCVVCKAEADARRAGQEEILRDLRFLRDEHCADDGEARGMDMCIGAVESRLAPPLAEQAVDMIVCSHADPSRGPCWNCAKAATRWAIRKAKEEMRAIIRRADKIVFDTYSNAQKLTWEQVEENCKDVLDILNSSPPTGLEPERAAHQAWQERAERAEDALRSLACYLSAGGYNAETVDADVFERKIRDGIARAETDARRAGQEEMRERAAKEAKNCPDVCDCADRIEARIRALPLTSGLEPERAAQGGEQPPAEERT